MWKCGRVNGGRVDGGRVEGWMMDGGKLGWMVDR